MQISTRGRYGLRAMVDLAMYTNHGPLALRVIAERQGLSDSYLEQVFNSLRKAGLVSAIRGSQGGYELSRPADQITVGHVLRALEGSLAPVHCVDEDSSKNPACSREKACITRSFWKELRDVINNFLDQTTLQDLVDRAQAESPDELMYFI